MKASTRWLIAANLVVALVLVGLWIAHLRSRPPSLADAVRGKLDHQGIMSNSDFDVFRDRSASRKIELAEKTVEEMPPPGADAGKWGAKLATVFLFLGSSKTILPEERARLAVVSRRIIEGAKRTGRPLFEQDGLRWLTNFGSADDVKYAAPYLQADDPETQKIARTAVRKLSGSKA